MVPQLLSSASYGHLRYCKKTGESDRMFANSFYQENTFFLVTSALFSNKVHWKPRLSYKMSN